MKISDRLMCQHHLTEPVCIESKANVDHRCTLAELKIDDIASAADYVFSSHINSTSSFKSSSKTLLFI